MVQICLDCLDTILLARGIPYLVNAYYMTHIVSENIKILSTCEEIRFPCTPYPPKSPNLIKQL